MRLFRTLYGIWMKFAHALGWVNTRIILTIVYFLAITPVALFFRIAGKDPMQRSFEDVGSYWMKRERMPEREDYRRQF